jgi:hypothetical protein
MTASVGRGFLVVTKLLLRDNVAAIAQRNALLKALPLDARERLHPI